jgi:hypothetical protein
MAFLLILLCPGSLLAQEARGKITGTVRDAGKAIVPGATVKVTSTDQGTTTTMPTNQAGIFVANFVPPGTYQITVEAKGFKKYVREGVIVSVNDSLELDISLEVGSVDQTVTVTADTPLLETATGSMGQVVDSRRIAELPIAHGDPYAIIGLGSGVSFSRDQRLDRPFEPTHIVGYSIDGTRANRSDLTIDGASSTSTANANEVIASFVPPQDLVQELKVQSATFDAAFGNTEGGVTNLSVKSGTNQFHGTAYYSMFTPGTSANDFYANRARQALADFYYHRFGGTVGGPVWIPKVYDGRNKTFFMYGIEGIREARPRNNGTLNTPTDKMRNGDFSELLALGTQYQIYNPFTRKSIAGGRIQSDPFVGNIIPAALINPIAKKFVDTYLARATSTPTAADGSGNFQQPGLMETAKYYSHTIRIDHVFNEKQRIFGRTSWYDRNSDYNNYYGNIATGTLFQFISRQAVVDDVWTINPTLILNLRYSYNRFIRSDSPNPANKGFDLASLGFPASYVNLIAKDSARFPRFDINSYQGTGFGADFRPTDTHNAVAQVTKAQGAHSIKGGFEFRSYRENSFFDSNNQTGQFNFDNTYTKGPLDNAVQPIQLGFSFAAFLLGLPSSGLINQPTSYSEQSLAYGVFLHDDWKVNNRLTVNIGIRYELEGALTERYNRSVSGFDFVSAQPIESQVVAKYALNPTPEIPASQFQVKGGLQYAGVNGARRELYAVPKNNWMPRLGFAFKINDKTVMRGGYGIFYGFLGQRRGDVIQTGYSSNTPLNVTTNNGLNFIETLSNPFQTGLRAVPGSSQGIQTFIGQSVTFFNQHPESPYMQRFQLGFQRELPGGFVGEVSYVGNRGTHIEMTRNLNATPLQYLSTSPTQDTTRINYLSALIPNPFAGLVPTGTFLSNATIARERLLRPFPHFDQVNTTTNQGYSWYHSLQTNLEKRFNQGYTLQMSYTYSKFMEAISYLNGADPVPTEMISDFDRPHRFASSGIVELPFGRGKKWGSDVPTAAQYVIGGWQVSAIYQFQSGPPLGDWGNIYFNGNVQDIALPGDQRTLSRWINTNAGFILNSTGNLSANVRRFPLRFGSIRGDKINNWDIGIIKKTRFGEGKKEFQYRAEFINAFNHPLYFTTAVNLNPSQAAFGQVTAGTQANYARRIQMTFKFLF